VLCSVLWIRGLLLFRGLRGGFRGEFVSPFPPLQPIPPWVSSPWSLFPLRQPFPLLPFRVRPRLRSDSPQKLTLRRLPPRLRRAQHLRRFHKTDLRLGRSCPPFFH